MTEVAVRRDPGSRGNDRDDLFTRFAAAVSCLAQGGLIFPAPFDLATSAALADNDDVGRLAREVHRLAADRDTPYQISISQTMATRAGLLTREVVNTSVTGTGVLIALLEGLLEELHQHDPD